MGNKERSKNHNNHLLHHSALFTNFSETMTTFKKVCSVPALTSGFPLKLGDLFIFEKRRLPMGNLKLIHRQLHFLVAYLGLPQRGPWEKQRSKFKVV